MRFKYLKLKLQRSQKNRSVVKYKQILLNKKINIIATNGGRFEYIYFFFIKKIFKKLIRKTNLFINRRSVWFLCSGNNPLSKKAKNSRMGSGKGYFLRWAINLKKNSKILIVKNIPKVLLYRIKKIWNRTIPFKVSVV